MPITPYSTIAISLATGTIGVVAAIVAAIISVKVALRRERAEAVRTPLRGASQMTPLPELPPS